MTAVASDTAACTAHQGKRTLTKGYYPSIEANMFRSIKVIICSEGNQNVMSA